VGETAIIDLYLELVVRPFVKKLLADPTIGKDKRSNLLLIVDGGDGTVYITYFQDDFLARARID
jgi:hypothetical protein